MVQSGESGRGRRCQVAKDKGKGRVYFRHHTPSGEVYAGLPKDVAEDMLWQLRKAGWAVKGTGEE